MLGVYMKWTERRAFKREVLDLQPGDEAGIKSITFSVTGGTPTACSWLKPGTSAGPHLADQAARRHTSFASMYVSPARSCRRRGAVDVEIDEKDLRVDTYRSSGAGGQRVNVTDSAVGLARPLPTGMRGFLSERAVAAREPGAGHEGPEVAAVRVEDEGAAGQARTARWRKAGHRVAGQPDPQLRAPAGIRIIKDHRTKAQRGDVDRRAGWRSRRVHQGLPGCRRRAARSARRARPTTTRRVGAEHQAAVTGRY